MPTKKGEASAALEALAARLLPLLIEAIEHLLASGDEDAWRLAQRLGDEVAVLEQ